MRNTKIGWTHSTINGSSGCDGCELWNRKCHSCYAGQVHELRLARRLPQLYAADFYDVRMIPGRFAQATSWGPPAESENADKPWLAGRPRHIFVGDMGDFLSAAVTDQFLEQELLAAVTSEKGRRHIWQFLTKRPARLARLSIKWGGLPANVVAMTTVTNQRTAEQRIPALLKVRAACRGLSVEPMLGPVDLSPWLASGELHWVIAGGESGVGCRPLDPDWVRTLRDQCTAAAVPFFFLQWGGVRKAQFGRTLDGKLHTQMPTLGETYTINIPNRIAA